MNTTKNRETGTMITLLNDGGALTLVCEDHDQAIDMESQRQARDFRSVPSEWCSGCYTIKTTKPATTKREFLVIGHNIFTDSWDNLGTVTAKNEVGANQKAHRAFGLDHYEFHISEVTTN